GLSSAPSTFIKVLLPEPDGPMMATISPSCTTNDTPRSACTSISPILYVFVTSLISIICLPSQSTWQPKSARPAALRARRRGGRRVAHHHVAFLQSALHFALAVVRQADRHRRRRRAQRRLHCHHPVAPLRANGSIRNEQHVVALIYDDGHVSGHTRLNGRR